MAGPPPATPVSVAPVVRERVPLEIRAVGNVDPFTTVQVKSQIAGELTGVRFTEGGDINKGDLLFEIDPRPYQDALEQAQAAVARDQAQLQQYQANLGRDQAQAKNAEADAERYRQLFKLGIAARNQSEQVWTTADVQREATRADEAAIASGRATLESDRAAVEKAKLDLSFCTIRSPISGRAGNLLVHAGNLVKVNDVPLVVINQIEPVFVSFGVPEHNLAKVRAATSGGRKLLVEVSPPNANGKSETGRLTVIDNAVDPATGTIKLKATCDNHARLLWPGQFVNVALRVEETEETLAPAEAVQAGQQGQFVYVVKPNHTVELRVVQVGQAVGGKVIVEKGVAPGETVVTDGQLRLFPGAPVTEVPAGKIDSQKL
jgi:multidrug efflux system membrane fusion protein